MRKFLPILIVFAVSAFSFSFPGNQDALVKQTAETNLQASLNLIPAGQETGFGFANREEFRLAQVGNVYRTITFNNDFYQDAILKDKDYIRLQDEWRVPVTVNGANRVLLTVFGKDSTLSVVDIGGTGLSKELQFYHSAYENGSDYILRIYPLEMDILVHTNPDQAISQGRYTPLKSAQMGIKELSEGQTFTLAQIKKIVKQKLSEQSKN